MLKDEESRTLTENLFLCGEETPIHLPTRLTMKRQGNIWGQLKIESNYVYFTVKANEKL